MMTKPCGYLLFILFLFSCSQSDRPADQSVFSGHPVSRVTGPSLIILGTLQDGGSPHIGCTKSCCIDLVTHPDPERMVVSVGIIDPEYGKSWLMEATPDISRQLHLLHAHTAGQPSVIPDGIFITHAHIGHYTGLMYLGREALGAREVPVYAMPRMKTFLENNGPWQQLVTLNNILLKELKEDSTIIVSPNIRITPFRVPHRDEYSETVGYRIEGPEKKALFIPDIDKWEKWERSIVDELAMVDYALIDATFYDAAEVNNRDIREIPHPLVTESLELLGYLPETVKSKIIFIHFNHSNPLLLDTSTATQRVKHAGLTAARTGTIIPL